MEGLYVNTSLLSCFKPLQLEMKAPFSSFFFPFEMQVKTPSCPCQRHLLSQLHNRKVFTLYHIFLLEPCVGTVREHKFAIMFQAITVRDEGSFFFIFFPFEMQVKTPSRPNQHHLLSQLYNRKVFTPYHIFLLEPCVGTVCEHTFAIMF